MTKQWEKYEAVKKYNSSFKPNKDYYESIKVQNNFYHGEQWVGLDGNNDLPHPTFNFIKRIIDFKISSLTSSETGINIEPLENAVISEDGVYGDTDYINAEVENILEKWNFRTLKKDLLRKGAITGDMCAHIIFNPNKKPYRSINNEVMGELEIEIIDATNVGFGNSNIKDVSKQPWIILIGRDTVKNLKEEAKQYKKNGTKDIEKDNETGYQVSEFAETEIQIDGDDEGKALYIYVYEKKIEKGEPKIYVSKVTENAVIYENIDTGLSVYPIAFDNWYRLDNTYHGRGEVEGQIPNQIAINKLFAMIIYHQMMTAFPTAIYDADVLESWNNQIGTAIELHGMQGRSIRDIAGYLNPADMSGYITTVIELCINYTKDCMGVSDASLGNVDPKNTSAILAVQKATAVPLENIKDNLYNFIEQIVNIIIDMMATKYGLRPVVMKNEDGQRFIEQYDFSKIKGIDLKLGIDVGEASYFSELAMLQTLDNLLSGGYIEFVDYLERVPRELLPKKDELISKLKEKISEIGNNEMYEQMATFMDQLPIEEQQRLKSMPPEQMEQAVRQMMGI